MRASNTEKLITAEAISALQDIKHAIAGDVYSTKLWRMLYASDASLYQVLPWGVICPKSENDCIKIREIAEAYRIPLIARGGGTSLAGQVVGTGFVVDLSRYMNRIIAIDDTTQQAVVEPGVVVSVLNQVAGKRGLMFAPDPSTLTRANIGGLIGNNAWGAHSPRYGETVDNIISLRTLISNGEQVEAALFGGLNQAQLSEIKQSEGLVGNLYKTIFSELDSQQKNILKHSLAKEVPNNVGYALDKLLRRQPWNPRGEPFSLVPLICGSEGSLGLITRATVKLVAKPQQRLMLVAHFGSLNAALLATRMARDTGAMAIELLDEVLISLISPGWLDKSAKALLLIEWQTLELQTEQMNNKQRLALYEVARSLISHYQKNVLGFHFPLLEDAQLDAAWFTRRSALGLLMGLHREKKAVTFIEDSAVPVESLVPFVEQVQVIMAAHKVACVYYGSVSRGLVHLRPLLNLAEQSDRKKLQLLMDEVLLLLIKYGGSLSAKHGDGRARGAYIAQQIGSELYSSLRKIKQAFDPNNIMNPGKLFDCPPIDSDLRAMRTRETKPRQTFFDWSQEGGLNAAVEKCNGAAVCRQPSGTGAMCPSYQTTLQEKDTTRGRANVFRQLLSDSTLKNALADQVLHEVLELCLACKSCMSECPASVNMARLKSEHLQHYYKQHSKPLIVKFIQNLEVLNKLASRFPQLSNAMLASQKIKSLFGISQQRVLPTLASQRLSEWFKQHATRFTTTKKPDIILLNNVFSEFYDVAIAKKAILSLEKLGYCVGLSPLFPSLRLALSQGLVEQASIRLSQSIDWLYTMASDGVNMIGLEPSEVLTYRDEASALCMERHTKEKIAIIADKVYLFEEFICQHGKQRMTTLKFPKHETHFLIHIHCHQRAIAGVAAIKTFFDLFPGVHMKLTSPGCCGMAGFFGYAKQTYKLSMDIGGLTLFPAIEKTQPETVIIAPGFSCRHQIMDGTGRRAWHPAEVFYQMVGNP